MKFGKLIGKPFLAIVDTDGSNLQRSDCAYTVRDFFVPKGYKAYLISSEIPEEYAKNLVAYCPESSILYDVQDITQFENYDVIEINENGSGRIVYQDSSIDNVLFITNKCNSNCIMCPDSDSLRKADLGNRKNYLDQLIDLLPNDVRHLTITGGEPTLLKWDLIDILKKCQGKFVNTDFLMLSNGRSFADSSYRQAFLESIPCRFHLAIPLYGASAEEHDGITRAPNSFDQTTHALKALQYKVPIEIRVVVMRSTYKRLPAIASYLISEFPHISSVSIMGIELMGNAAIKKNELWVDFEETVPYIEQAIQILMSGGIEPRIYNYPLCSLPRHLWSLASKSITGYKIQYPNECTECAVKSLCGGFFFSTLHLAGIQVRPILEGEK